MNAELNFRKYMASHGMGKPILIADIERLTGWDRATTNRALVEHFAGVRAATSSSRVEKVGKTPASLRVTETEKTRAVTSEVQRDLQALLEAIG